MAFELPAGHYRNKIPLGMRCPFCEKLLETSSREGYYLYDCKHEDTTFRLMTLGKKYGDGGNTTIALKVNNNSDGYQLFISYSSNVIEILDAKNSLLRQICSGVDAVDSFMITKFDYTSLEKLAIL